MLRKRYGTPLPPGMRHRRLPALPRTMPGLFSVARKPKGIVAVLVSVGVLALVITTVMSLTAAPPRQRLDQDGVKEVVGAVSFTRPGGWDMAVQSIAFDKPLVLFAPGQDSNRPPVTISIVSEDVTATYTNIVGADGAQVATTTTAVLDALVHRWADQMNHGAYDVTPSFYGLGAASGVIPASVIVDWRDPQPWHPGSLGPIPTAPPFASNAALPSAATSSAPTVAPSLVPSAAPTNQPTSGPIASTSVVAFSDPESGASMTLPTSVDGTYANDQVTYPIYSASRTFDSRLYVTAGFATSRTLDDFRDALAPAAGRTVTDVQVAGVTSKRVTYSIASDDTLGGPTDVVAIYRPSADGVRVVIIGIRHDAPDLSSVETAIESSLRFVGGVKAATATPRPSAKPTARPTAKPTTRPTATSTITPTPSPVVDPVLGPSATPAPAASADASTPAPSDSSAPIMYVHQVQMLALPSSSAFSGQTSRRAVVVTLTYPADLDPAIIKEARTSFDALVTSLFFE
jgi:hypothetical protein